MTDTTPTLHDDWALIDDALNRGLAAAHGSGMVDRHFVGAVNAAQARVAKRLNELAAANARLAEKAEQHGKELEALAANNKNMADVIVALNKRPGKAVVDDSALVKPPCGCPDEKTPPAAPSDPQEAAQAE